MNLDKEKDLIKKIKNFSSSKKESKKILDSRLLSFKKFLESNKPVYGPDLKLDYSEYNYFDNNNMNIKDVETEEFIICDIHTALKKHKNKVIKYFDKLILEDNSMFSHLNSAVWSNGFFIYIYPNKKVTIPLELTNFSKNLIVIDNNSQLNLIDINLIKDPLIINQTEVYVLDNAICECISVQSCSKKSYNFAIKKFQTEKNGYLHFVNISFGSKVSMSYPSINLNGENSTVDINNLLIANKNQIIDEGINLNHIGINSVSNLFLNTVALNNGETTFRKNISIDKEALYSTSTITYTNKILDNYSKCDLVSKNSIENSSSLIEYKNKFENKPSLNFKSKKYIKDFFNDIGLENDLKKYLEKLLK